VDEASRELSETLSVVEVYNAVCRAAARIASPPGEEVKRAFIVREAPDAPDMSVVMAEYDESGTSMIGTRFPVKGHPQAYEAYVNNTPFAGPIDVDRCDPMIAAVIRASGVRHGAWVPLVRRNESLVMLAVSGRQRRGFTRSQVARLSALGSNATLAIANARAHEDLAISARKLAELAATDPMTGLPNRREFDKFLHQLPRETYSIVAIDIDDLKPVNDTYGHDAGDELITAVSQALNGVLRTGDVLARLGGDEFCALLHGANAEGAALVARRMRAAVAALDLPSGRSAVSIGCATGRSSDDIGLVMKAADKALYAAKRSGKNSVRVEKVSRTAIAS
jgi:diguanylate cyclase (GGDEF)-like protein